MVAKSVKRQNAYKKIQTISTTLYALLAGYVLVLFFTVFGHITNLIFFTQPHVHIALYAICGFNILWGILGAYVGNKKIFIDDYESNHESDSVSDSSPGKFYFFIMYIASASSIFSLFYIIEVTGGMYFSPFVGFYSMQLSILVVIFYLWKSKILTKALIKVAIYFFINAGFIFYACYTDPLELTFKYPITISDKNVKEAINNIPKYTSKIGYDISYDGDDIILRRPTFYTKISDKDRTSFIDEFRQEIGDAKENDPQSIKSLTAITHLIKQYEKFYSKDHNLNFKKLYAFTIIFGILTAILLQLLTKEFRLKE